RGQWIEGVRRSSAHRRADEERNKSCPAIFTDLFCQGVRPHGKLLVYGNQAQIVPADAGDLNVFFDRRMRLMGRVRHQPAVATPFVGGEICSALTRGEQGTERSAGSGVLDDSTTGPGREKFSRQVEHLDQPIEHMGLKLRTSGAGGPEHSLYSES